VDIDLLDPPEGQVIACGSYLGGPDYEFVVWDDGQVYFRVVGDHERVWAGRDADSFRRIATAWSRYESEVRELAFESAQLARVSRMREELARLGAFPADPPSGAEPLWSLLIFEAENGLG
jgi:hypothetical protein